MNGVIPHLHRYADYRWLRGFNIIPSWGARIEQAWWDYHPDRFRKEAALATTAHANCIRLWIEFTAWMAAPDKVQASFMWQESASRTKNNQQQE